MERGSAVAPLHSFTLAHSHLPTLICLHHVLCCGCVCVCFCIIFIVLEGHSLCYTSQPKGEKVGGEACPNKELIKPKRTMRAIQVPSPHHKMVATWRARLSQPVTVVCCCHCASLSFPTSLASYSLLSWPYPQSWVVVVMHHHYASSVIHIATPTHCLSSSSSSSLWLQLVLQSLQFASTHVFFSQRAGHTVCYHCCIISI